MTGKPKKLRIKEIKLVSENLTATDGELILTRDVVSRKTKNFPYKGEYNHPVKILPSHRLVYQNYKDQGFRHLGKAIRKTGVYSESLARKVNVLTKSQSWQALMDEKLPEDHVATRHAELLDKRDYRKVVDAKGNVVMVDNGPNTAAVTKAIELSYRMRGKFKDKQAPPASTVMYNLFYKPEVRGLMKNFEENIKEQLTHEIARKHKADVETEEENQALLESYEGTGEGQEGAGEGV